MKKMIIVLLLIISTFTHAEILWELQIGEMGGYSIFQPSIAITENGSFLLVRHSNSVEGILLRGYITKISESGQFNGDIWERLENYEDFVIPFGIIKESNGNFITAGRVLEQDFSYIIKRDSTGSKIWEQEIPDFYVENIVKNDSTGFTLMGNLNDTGLAAIRKFDFDGNVLWTKSFQIGANWSSFKKGIPTNDGCLAFIGTRYFSETETDGIILKVDAQGDSLWSQIQPDNSNRWVLETSEDMLYVISSNDIKKLDANGNIITAFDGNFDYGIDLNNENSFLTRYSDDYSSSIYDAYKYDYDFNNIWSTTSFRRFYFVQLPDNGFLFFKDTGIHLIRTDSAQVSVNNDIIFHHNIPLKNYPNPFNPSTTIQFELSLPADIEISIYDIKGRKIRDLTNSHFSKGSHTVNWDGDDESENAVNSGVYLYQLKIDGTTMASKKCLLLK